MVQADIAWAGTWCCFFRIAPVTETLIGMVDKLGDAGVQKWQHKLRQLGRAAT